MKKSKLKFDVVCQNAKNTIVKDSVAIKMYAFRVLGHPVGMERHRNGRHGGKFIPPKTRDYQEQIRVAFRERYSGDHKDATHLWRLTITAIFHNRKFPDQSNVLKTVEDALQGILWQDDRQIDIIHMYRWVMPEQSEALWIWIEMMQEKI